MPGFGFGIATFVELLMVVVLIVAAWSWRKGALGVTLVLREFHVSPDPEAPTLIRIVGRISGIVAWLLTSLQLSPEVEFHVTQQDLSIRSSSLSGVSHLFVPIDHISSTECGYRRSLLALGIVLINAVAIVVTVLSFGGAANSSEVGGMLGAVFIDLIIGGIAGLFYYLSKRIMLKIETEGGEHHGILFKRSVMEGVSVDLPDALRAIALLNAHILTQSRRKSPGMS